MLSDRFWGLKLALALGLFALLCRQAQGEFGKLHPDLEAAAADIREIRGKTVHVWAHPVLALVPDGFEIGSDVGAFHVRSPSPAPRVGDRVSLVATVLGPRRLAASRVKVEDGYFWKRGLNYGLSSLTLLAFLWMARKRYQFRLSEGLLRSRY